MPRPEKRLRREHLPWKKLAESECESHLVLPCLAWPRVHVIRMHDMPFISAALPSARSFFPLHHYREGVWKRDDPSRAYIRDKDVFKQPDGNQAALLDYVSKCHDYLVCKKSCARNIGVL